MLINLGFLAIYEKKKNIFYYFLDFVWQKSIFSYNKTTQNKLKGCLSNIPFNQNKPKTKQNKTKSGTLNKV